MIFVVEPSRAGLIVARIISGVSGSNLGGIGFGPLVAGLLAQFAPSPLVLPYVVFGIGLVVMALLVAISPETVRRPDPRPRCRPQRVAVRVRQRSLFYAATVAGLAAFAVYGVFNSLVPSFLAGSLHEPPMRSPGPSRLRPSPAARRRRSSAAVSPA